MYTKQISRKQTLKYFSRKNHTTVH